MNQKERELLGDLYQYVRANSLVRPSNPMDIRGLAQGAKRAEKAIDVTMTVVSQIGFGDLEDARDTLDAAVSFDVREGEANG